MGTYKYRGVEFDLDDSAGCYIEVSYKDVKGYVGVNLSEHSASRFIWYGDSSALVKDGLQYGNSHGNSLESNLNELCDNLLRRQELAEKVKAFDSKAKEAACEELHDFVKNNT